MTAVAKGEGVVGRNVRKDVPRGKQNGKRISKGFNLLTSNFHWIGVEINCPTRHETRTAHGCVLSWPPPPSRLNDCAGNIRFVRKKISLTAQVSRRATPEFRVIFLRNPLPATFVLALVPSVFKTGKKVFHANVTQPLPTGKPGLDQTAPSAHKPRTEMRENTCSTVETTRESLRVVYGRLKVSGAEPVEGFAGPGTKKLFLIYQPFFLLANS